MADQDTQELSMTEILDSIRNILNGNGGSHTADEEPAPEPIADNQADVPFVAIHQEPPAQEKISDPTEEDIANICNNIRRLMDQPQTPVARTYDSIAKPIVTSQVIPLKVSKTLTNANDDISSDILDDFAAIFAKRRQQYPQTDASVRNIAEAAVLNEVVPVLQQWLQEKLPQAVQKEIERVMVKAGTR